MIRTISQCALLCLFALLVAGCAESDREKANGKAEIRGVNAIVNAPGLVFRIEARSLGSVEYGDSTALAQYDDLSYTFNFDLLPIGESDSTRLASQFVDVDKDMQYLFVLAGTLANPQLNVWSRALRAWDGTETVLELGFLHLNNTVGTLDVYVAAAGVAPATGNAIGTLSYGESLPVSEYVAGQYVITLTSANNPLDIVFQSPTRTFVASTTDTILILDRTPSRTSDVFVRQMTGNGSVVDVADARFPPIGRFLHAAIAVGNVDVAQADDFTNLLISDQAYGNLSGEVSLAAGNTDFTWTDSGNQGAILLETTETIPSGFYTTLAFVGPATDPDVMNIISTRRGVATHGQIAVIQTAANHASVDVYILGPGETVADTTADFANVPFKLSTGMNAILAGAYRIAVTPLGEKTLLAGPIDMPIAKGDVLEVYVLDTVDPNTVSILLDRIAP